MKKWKKRLAVWIAAFMLASGLAAAPELLQAGIINENVTNAQANPKASGIQVSYHTQKEISDYVKAHPAEKSDALTFAKEPVVSGNYDMGELSAETQQSALNMLKQIRYIAGISDQVTLNEQYTRLAQAATLTNYVNNKLSHYPTKPEDMDADLYELGASGACRSNIAWASWSGRSLNETIVNGWMNDGDSYNIDRIGHRRWLLNPKMAATGFGAVSGSNGTYSAVYAFDRGNTSASEYGVCWPAQNMPVEYFGSSFPWSVSTGTSENPANVKVTLTNRTTGQVWHFSASESDGAFYVNNDGYGQSGCIIFRPEGVSSYMDGDSYQVDITGLVNGDISYTVKFFNLYLKEVVINISNTWGLTYDGTDKQLSYSIFGNSNGFNKISDKKAEEIDHFKVAITKDGAPVSRICDAGDYVVTAEYNDGVYFGKKTQTISVAKANARITLGSLQQTEGKVSGAAASMTPASADASLTV